MSNLVWQAHNEYVMAEKKREEWELKNHREGEILEMVEIFEVRNGNIRGTEWKERISLGYGFSRETHVQLQARDW